MHMYNNTEYYYYAYTQQTLQRNNDTQTMLINRDNRQSRLKTLLALLLLSTAFYATPHCRKVGSETVVCLLNK